MYWRQSTISGSFLYCFSNIQMKQKGKIDRMKLFSQIWWKSRILAEIIILNTHGFKAEANAKGTSAMQTGCFHWIMELKHYLLSVKEIRKSNKVILNYEIAPGRSENILPEVHKIFNIKCIISKATIIFTLRIICISLWSTFTHTKI